MRTLNETLDALALAHTFERNIITRGIEKENLRVTADGLITQTDHPAALGSTLTHPTITKDFSEALPELITPPIVGDLSVLYQNLHDVQTFVVHNLPTGELLWPGSMPGFIAHDTDIRIAEYGSSHVGQMKHVYRRGLSYRYGRMMQAVAGIHYNFSVSDTFFQALRQLEHSTVGLLTYKSEKYMGLIRSFYRHYWLLPYLLGASPACMKNSIAGDVPDYLSAWSGNSYFGEYATSLRMSELGYQSSTQSDLQICYNSAANYARTLWQATRTPYSTFTNIGIEVEGEWCQLSDGILQIENEFYSPIRPKQPIRSGEMPSVALHCRGVEYVELRCTDLNPLLPLNIDVDTMAFLDVFMFMCLLLPDHLMPQQECAEMRANFRRVVERGRDPLLQLQEAGQQKPFQAMAAEVFVQLQHVAKWLDANFGCEQFYQNCVAAQQRKLADVTLTPSQQIVSTMQAQRMGYAELMLQLAESHTSAFRQARLAPETLAEFQQTAAASHASQAALEAETHTAFSDYLSAYFQQAEKCFQHCQSVEARDQ